jgi:D-amino peptidase
MRVYISVDMEGTAGISHPRVTFRTDQAYQAAVALMTGEVNAAIEGALSGGATEILVNDGHMSQHNLPPAEINPVASLLQGNKVWSIIAGAGSGSIPGPGGTDVQRFDVAMFIGYHAYAGHPTGALPHTYSPRPVRTTLNGRPIGETGINAVVLGAWGIPVGMVSGDDAVMEEVADWLPGAERAQVKLGAGSTAALSLHPSVAQKMIRESADRAARRALAGDLQPLRLDKPCALEVEYRAGSEADYASFVPGARRSGERTVIYESDDPVMCYRAFVSGVLLANNSEAY